MRGLEDDRPHKRPCYLHGSLVLCVCSWLSVVACGSSSTIGFTSYGDDASSGSSDTSGASDSGSGSTGSGSTGLPPAGDGSSPILGIDDDAGAPNGGGCSAASQLAYVLSSDNDIYSFDPPSKVFTKISTLQCQAGGMSPNSMAVDRLGNAWVNYVGNSGAAIFEVVIATGSCQPTNIVLTPAWYQLGMAYSTASTTDPTETLYVAAPSAGGSSSCGPPGGGGNSASGGLAVVNTTSGSLTTVGPFSGSLAGQSAELTGTGDGRLFGFFVLDPVEVAQIDKSSGATSNPIVMTGVSCPESYAFSFWGGDFYLYTANGNANSSVTRYTSADGGIDTSYVADVGFQIQGAGVSTCAPTTPPPPK